MTREEIEAIPSAAVSTTPDTVAICGWLKVIALQLADIDDSLWDIIKALPRSK